MEGEPGRRSLSIAFSEPVDKRAVLEISCRMGSLAANGRRVFAMPRLRAALLGRTTLRIRTSPEISLADWQFGHFRPEAPPQIVRDAMSSWETLVLTQAGFGGAGGTLYPSASVHAPALDVAVQQDAWWHVGIDQSTLTAGLTWQVRSGQLSTLLVQTPAGWDIVDLDLAPSELLRDWYRDKKRAGEPLVVDLKSLVGTGKSIRLTLKLRSAERLLSIGRKTSIPFPWISPVGVRWQEENLAIELERGQGGKGPLLFRASASGVPARELPASLRISPFFPALAADFYYTNHGNPAPGTLDVEPIAPRVQLQAYTEIIAEPTHSGIVYSLYLDPVAGSPQMVALCFGTMPPVHWEVVAGTNALDGQPRQGGRSPDVNGDIWEFRFRQPLRDKVTLRGNADLPLAAKAVAPLPRSASPADPFVGAVSLRARNGVAVDVESTGLQLAEPDVTPGTGSALPIWRAYRYGTGAPSLAFSVRSSEMAVPAGPIVESVEFVSQAGPEGTIVSRYRCVVRNPRQRRLRVQLPPNARLQTLTLDGAAIPTPEIHDDEVVLPVAGATASYELTFAERSPTWSLITTLPRDGPNWESDVVVLQQNRFWVLPRTVVPFAFLASFQAINPTSSTQSLAADWIMYEVGSSDAALYCLRGDLPHLGGILLALVATCVGLTLRRQTKSRRWYLGMGLWMCVIALMWLPDGLRPLAWWPLAAILASVWIWRLAPAQRASSSVAVAARVALASFFIIQAALPQSSAQRPADDDVPTTVYVLPPSAEHSEQQNVLVPRRLWAKLNALAADKPLEVPPFIVLQTDYSGKMMGTFVEMEAEFQTQIFRDGLVDVKLPLGQVRLKQVLLDSAPVLAVPTRQPDGFAVSVEGKGQHLIKLTWEMHPRPRGDEMELQWTVPAAGANRLSMTIPGAGIPIRVIGNRGGRWLTQSPTASRLEADLGRVAEATIRWPATATPGQMQVREAYLLELQPQEAHLRAVLRYEISNGAASRLQMQLPLGLDVKSVDVKSDSGPDAGPRLQSWSMSPGRELSLDLSYPVSGKLRVHLDLLVNPALLSDVAEVAPLAPVLGGWRAGVLELWAGLDTDGLTASRTIHIPWLAHRSAKRVEGYWAYRAEQLLVASLRPARAPSSLDKENFTRLWPAELGGLTNVQGFAAVPASGGAATLRVRPLIPRLQVAQHLNVGLRSAEADFNAQLDVAVTDGTLTLLEWQVPGDLTIADVQGSELLRWSRQGNIVQVWLKRGLAPPAGGEPVHCNFNLTGWLLQTREPGKGERVALPRLRVLNAQSQTTSITLFRRIPMTVREENLIHLRHENSPPTPEPVYGVYSATQADYAGVLRIFPENAGPPVAAPPASPPTASPGPGTNRAATDVQVMLAEYDSKLDLRHQAIHTATFTLLYQAGATWSVTLPDGATLIEVLVDHQSAAGVQLSGNQLRIPLPARAGWCEVSVAWGAMEQFDASGQWTFRPPRLDTETQWPAVWTLRVPAMMQTSGNRWDHNAFAWQCLRRAEALAKIAQQLSNRWKSDTVAWHEAQMAKDQERFQGQLREAERRLRLAGSHADEAALARLAALGKENQRALRDSVWDGLRSKTEDLVKDLPWLAVNQDATTESLAYSFPEAPTQLSVRLAAPPSTQRVQRLLASFVVTAMALAWFVVSRRKLRT
jgi:hypothetical protein